MWAIQAHAPRLLGKPNHQVMGTNVAGHILLEHLHHCLLARRGRDLGPNWGFESPLFHSRYFNFFIVVSFINTHLDHVQTKNEKIFMWIKHAAETEGWKFSTLFRLSNKTYSVTKFIQLPVSWSCPLQFGFLAEQRCFLSKKHTSGWEERDSEALTEE